MFDSFINTFKFNSRKMNEYEITEAKKVFGESINYKRITMDESSFIAWMGNVINNSGGQSAVVTFNTINFTEKLNAQNVDEMGLLIHELTHIAQYNQVGVKYMTESIAAQKSEQGYDYGGITSLAGKRLSQFNREQQGEILRDYYLNFYDIAGGPEELKILDIPEHEHLLWILSEEEMESKVNGILEKDASQDYTMLIDLLLLSRCALEARLSMF